MMGALGKEIKQFGGEIHDMVGEMKRARVAVQDMRSKLSEVASGDLAEDAERLGRRGHERPGWRNGERRVCCAGNAQRPRYHAQPGSASLTTRRRPRTVFPKTSKRYSNPWQKEQILNSCGTR